MKKKFLQFLSWIERVSELNSLSAVLSYAVLLIALLTGCALTYTTSLSWMLLLVSPAAVICAVLLSALLLFPYWYGLSWRIVQFNAARGSWLALLSALI